MGLSRNAMRVLAQIQTMAGAADYDPERRVNPTVEIRLQPIRLKLPDLGDDEVLAAMDELVSAGCLMNLGPHHYSLTPVGVMRFEDLRGDDHGN